MHASSLEVLDAAPAPALYPDGGGRRAGVYLVPFGLARLSAVQGAMALIAGFLVLRLIAAGLVGLGVDESYSLAIARQLQLSYFDHPPLHQWIIHFFGGMLGYGRAARLPFIFMFAGSTWLLFDLTRHLFGARAGLWAVLAINLSGFFTAVAGSWVLPDGPLIFCLLAAANPLARLVFSNDVPGANEARQMRLWLLAGFWIGLAGLSKYQAVIFAFGVGAFLVGSSRGRAWLKRPGPYLAAAVAVVMIAPVIVWNAQHDWASFVFQGGRAAPAHAPRPASVLTSLLGPALLLLPWVSAPLGVAALSWRRHGWTDERRWFCIALGVPGILLFGLTPLWGQASLPHWAMSAWLFLLPLLGEMLAHASADHRWPKVWASGSFAALLVLWALLVSDASTGWVGRTWPTTFAKGDPTLESVEWTALSRDLAGLQLFRQPGLFIVSLKWMEAGKIAQAFGDGPMVVVASDDPRGFAYGRNIGDLVGRSALIIARADDLTSALDRLRPCFARLQPLQAVELGRMGYPETRLNVVLASELSASCSGLGQGLRRAPTIPLLE